MAVKVPAQPVVKGGRAGGASADARTFRFDHKSPQRFVGGAALLAAAVTLFAILWPLRYSLLATWAVVEAVFFVLVWRPRYAELNAQPARHEPNHNDALRTFQRFLRFCKELPHGMNYESYYSGWFHGAPFKDIKRENAEDFMAYGFWYRSKKQMAAMGLGDIPRKMVDQLEQTWQVKFEPGYNPRLQFMGHLWEPLNASWRPLAFYIATELIGMAARLLLKRWGFEHHKHNGLSYFTLGITTAAAPAARPATHSRATSSSTLADMAAAAAVPGVHAAEVQSGLPPPMRRPASGSRLSSVAVPEAAASASAGGSPSKPGLPRVPSASGLVRSKSSPFEAGPPDWTPFADPNGPAARAASDELAGSTAAAAVAAAAAAAEPGAAGGGARAAGSSQAGSPSAAASGSVLNFAGSQRSLRGPGQPPQQQPRASFAPAVVEPVPGAPLVPGLSMRASMMLRSAANPLQGALSEGLGSADIPVLFLHGVGGLPAYLEMMLHVIGLGHPVIAVEFRGVSMRLGKVYTADEVADSVVGVLDKLGIKEACVVGHSYGTFIAGMLARHHRKRVHTLCLIDPVCFGMFMPHLLYNFLYRKPHWRGWGLHELGEYAKDAGRLVASRDMHVCATFARRFYWSDLNLWPEDLAPGSVVILSGKDDLMNAAEVKDMLDIAGHVKVYFNHELTHGAFLLDHEVKQTILAEMRALLARSGSAVVGLARPVLARTLTLMNGLGIAPGGLSMKKGGGQGRYYVEDHGNQLVRTFTGNLTKMLEKAGRGPTSASLAPRPQPGGGSGCPAGAQRSVSGGGVQLGAATGSAAAGAPGAGEWTASRLMQTFSGPVRRRFAPRSWGGQEAGSSSGDGDQAVQQPAAGGAAAAGAAAAAGSKAGPGSAAAPRVGKVRTPGGSAAAGRASLSKREAVARIDEDGEEGKEV